ncbi:MAG: hypothetical protein RLZZ436_3453 [Planctomycetota bacterium]|jgi:hypothetical protein
MKTCQSSALRHALWIRRGRAKNQRGSEFELCKNNRFSLRNKRLSDSPRSIVANLSVRADGQIVHKRELVIWLTDLKPSEA